MAVDLYFSFGKACVWNAEDWSKLRKDHRIVGELIGTIPSFPRHSGFCGFPMVLMTEEARLLVENKICRLIEIENLDELPTKDIVNLSKEAEERIQTEQIKCLKSKRIEQIASRIDLIVAGKTKKLKSQGKTTEINREKLIEDEIKKLQPPSSSNILVQIPIEHPWPLDVRLVDVDELQPNLENSHNKLKYDVFKDLWNKGYYVSAGTKFGGDFLVYPGDPVKFHATYIVRCVKNQSDKISLSDIVGFGRLGVSVNKLTVFAYKNSNDKICYQTVQWHETLY